MSQVLELAQLVDQHRVPEVKIRRRRIESGLDAQRPAGPKARLEFVGLEDFIGAATDQVEGGLQLGHCTPWVVSGSRLGRAGAHDPGVFATQREVNVKLSGVFTKIQPPQWFDATF
jgi:hypothetical protein